jgi:hypothetical protein
MYYFDVLYKMHDVCVKIVEAQQARMYKIYNNVNLKLLKSNTAT